MYSAAVDTLIETGRVIKRSFMLEIRNGFSACDDPPGEFVWVPVTDFEINITENVPTIGSMRARLAVKDFEYFDEFDHEYYDHGNPVMLYAEARIQCTVYLETGTGLAGTITGVAGTQTITGAGTGFLADFVPGDLIYIDAYPEIRLMVREVINNTDIRVYDIIPDGFAGAAYSIVDAEREYIFRGYITDREITDKTIIIEAFDWLNKLQNSILEISREADVVVGSPFVTVALRREPNLNLPGESYVWEIDAAAHPWAENPDGLNRVFVPGVFEIQENVPPWTSIEASEFQIIMDLGLIEFKNDMFGSTLQLLSVSVYQEGSLELEDVIVDMLTDDSTDVAPNCLNIAPGFDDTTWREALPGTFTFVNGSTTVNGAGNFDADLRVGDRIAHNATPDTFGIVVDPSPATPNQVILQYPYAGASLGPLAGFKSTIRASFLSLTTVDWGYCDGTAAALMRLLQKSYADVRGYRLWYDPMDDVIRGERVEIAEDADARDLGLIGSLVTNITNENFYSAIAVKGTLDRATNLSTAAAASITDLAVLAGWNRGFEHSGATAWGGMTWCNAAGCEAAIIDADETTAYAVWKAPLVPTVDSYHEFVKIDLGAAWDVGEIFVYAPPIKNSTYAGQTWGVTLEGSLDDVTYTAMSADSYQINFDSNEMKSFEFEVAYYRYIKISMRPVKWVSGGDYATMGLREVIIFGSQSMCEVVCVQNHTAPGAPPYTEGQGGHYVGGVFISDYYPEIIKKLCNVGHQVLIDDSGLVFSAEEARDRAYLLLDEYIRLYRQITWSGPFDPRIQIYNTVHTRDVYRENATDELYFLVESVTISNDSTSIQGREYGGGPLAPNYS